LTPQRGLVDFTIEEAVPSPFVKDYDFAGETDELAR
jgi:hypothetical protein